ncbi:MAG: glycosyltransferase family 4 protein [Pseudomonadota bacterium]
MRVLAISSHADTLVSVRPEAASFIGLARAGVEMHVMTQGDSPCAQDMREAGIHVIDYHPKKKWARESIGRIRSEIDTHDVDIVYAFNNKAICNAAFACRGRRAKLVTYRGQTGNLSRWDPAAYLTHLHPRVDAIIGVANAVTDFLKPVVRPGVGVTTVYKGHNLDWYTDAALPRAELGLDEDDFVVACVANNRPRKGVDYLVRACGELGDLDNLKLLLVGQGMDHETLGEALAEADLEDRAVLLGPRSDATAVIQAADVSVLPSTKREGLPKTVIEAMAYAIPCVVTDTGGNAELVVDGETGVVVPVADASAIANAVRELRDNPALARRYGDAGRARIAASFSVDGTVTGTRAVFARLLAND